MQQSKGSAKKYEGGEEEETGGDSERKKPRGSHIINLWINKKRKKQLNLDKSKYF